MGALAWPAPAGLAPELGPALGGEGEYEGGRPVDRWCRRCGSAPEAAGGGPSRVRASTGAAPGTGEAAGRGWRDAAGAWRPLAADSALSSGIARPLAGLAEVLLVAVAGSTAAAAAAGAAGGRLRPVSLACASWRAYSGTRS